MGISKVEINNADGTKNVLVDLTGDTVTADMLAKGVTAHGADGELVTGTIKEGNPSHKPGTPSYSSNIVEIISIKSTASEDAIIRSGSKFSTSASASDFGDATAEDVAKGKTFTSFAGLKVTGTAEPMVSNDNCEAYHITDKSTALNFKRTDGDIKVWGYGAKKSTYTTTLYAFVGDGYYTGTSYGTPSKKSVTWSFNTDGTLSGLPSGLTALNVLVTKGI